MCSDPDIQVYEYAVIVFEEVFYCAEPCKHRAKHVILLNPYFLLLSVLFGCN